MVVKQLLVVDSNIEMLRACKESFLEYNVRVAVSAKHAIEVLAEGYKPDYILLENDIHERDEGIAFLNTMYIGCLGFFPGDTRIALWSPRMCSDIKKRVDRFSGVKCFVKPTEVKTLVEYFKNGKYEDF